MLIVLSICDSLLIIFFILVSTSTTVMSSEPHWFIYIFPYLLWPLGNISITSTVLMVVAVSTERYITLKQNLFFKSHVFWKFLTMKSWRIHKKIHNQNIFLIFAIVRILWTIILVLAARAKNSIVSHSDTATIRIVAVVSLCYINKWSFFWSKIKLI